MCLLEVAFILRPILGVNCPKNLHFGVCKSVFSIQAGKIFKLSYNQNCYSDSNQNSHSDTDQVVFAGHHKMHTTKPRWQTAAILTKWKITISQQPFDQFRLFICHMTCFRARMRLLGVMLISHPILLIKCPKKHFWGVRRRFQAKCTKYSKFCTLKRPKSSFCELIRNVFHKSKMADGRHLEKMTNCYISVIIWQSLTINTSYDVFKC